MLMMAPPIFEAVEHVITHKATHRRIVFLGPAGERFTQDKAKELATYDQLVLVCGHYEGIDYRVKEHLVDETIAIGDFVVTGCSGSYDSWGVRSTNGKCGRFFL